MSGPSGTRPTEEVTEVSWELASLLRRQGLGPEAESAEVQVEWTKGAEAAGFSDSLPLGGRRRSSIVGPSGELSVEYRRKRVRDTKLREQGVDPLRPVPRRPAWGVAGGPPPPRSKVNTLLAMRGLRDLRNLPRGCPVRVSPELLARAAGLDPLLLHRKSILDMASAAASPTGSPAGSPPRRRPRSPASRLLRHRPPSRPWRPPHEPGPPPPILPPGDKQQAGDTFHQWYLRERRREMAEVEQEQPFHAGSVVAAEERARGGVLLARSDFAALCRMVLAPGAGGQTRLSQALRCVTAHRDDALLVLVALRGVRGWVAEAWSSAHFVARGGIAFLASAIAAHARIPAVVEYAAQSLASLTSFAHTHAQVLRSNALFNLLGAIHGYRFHPTVLRGLVSALLSLAARSPLRDFIALICGSPKGLPLIVALALRFPDDARLVQPCLRLVALVAEQPAALPHLVHRQGMRGLAGLVEAWYPARLRMRAAVARALCGAAASRAARPALTLHGAGLFLARTVDACAAAACAAPGPGGGAAEDAEGWEACAADALDAVLRFVSNPQERGCSSLTHALPPALLALRRHCDAGVAARAEQVLQRLRGAPPLVTAGGLRAGLPAALAAAFRPHAELELRHQLPASAEPPLPDPPGAPEQPGGLGDAPDNPYELLNKIGSAASLVSLKSEMLRDMRETTGLGREMTGLGVGSLGSFAGRPVAEKGPAVLSYDAVVHPPGDAAVVRCHFGDAGSADCPARAAFLCEVELRAGVAHPSIAGLVGWSVRDCTPVVHAGSVPRVPQTVYYIALDGDGEPMEQVAAEHCGRARAPPPRPATPPHPGLRELCDGLRGDAPQGLRAVAACLPAAPAAPPPAPAAPAAAPGALTYGDCLAVASDCAGALRHLHAAGRVHGDVRLHHVYRTADSRNRQRYVLRWPRPERPPPGGAAAAERNDVRCLGRLVSEVLFAGADMPLRLFLNCLAAPKELSPLLLNAVVAPCFGCRLLGDLAVLDFDSDPGTPTGDEQPAAAGPPPAAQYSAADAFAAVQDCALIAALRAAYDDGGGGGGEGGLRGFCDWVGALAAGAAGATPAAAPLPPAPRQSGDEAVRSPDPRPATRDSGAAGGVYAAGEGGDFLAVRFHRIAPGGLAAALREWGCSTLEDIPSPAEPLPQL